MNFAFQGRGLIYATPFLVLSLFSLPCFGQSVTLGFGGPFQGPTTHNTIAGFFSYTNPTYQITLTLTKGETLQIFTPTQENALNYANACNNSIAWGQGGLGMGTVSVSQGNVSLSGPFATGSTYATYSPGSQSYKNAQINSSGTVVINGTMVYFTGYQVGGQAGSSLAVLNYFPFQITATVSNPLPTGSITSPPYGRVGQTVVSV